MTEFFTYVEGPKPDFKRTEPLQALKDYIEECGGNPERAIVHFAPPPPPLAPEEARRSTIKCVTRKIASPAFATAWEGNGVAWTTLLCCWDDPIKNIKCIREDCPYRHASQLSDLPNGGGQDFFELIPCTFAGMSEGCKWHNHRLKRNKWVVPPFEVKESIEDAAPTKTEGVEFGPTYDGQKWLLQQCGICTTRPVVTQQEQQDKDAAVAQLAAAMRAAVKRYLDGECIGESDDEGTETRYQ